MPRSDASPPAPQSGAGQQTQLPAQGKVKGQNPRVGRGRGQGTTNSPGPTTPMQISQILQPPSRSEYSTIFTSALVALVACSRMQGYCHSVVAMKQLAVQLPVSCSFDCLYSPLARTAVLAGTFIALLGQDVGLSVH